MILLIVSLCVTAYGKKIDKSVLESIGYNELDSFKNELSWGNTYRQPEKAVKVWSTYLEKFEKMNFDNTSKVEFNAWKSKFYELLEEYYNKSKEAAIYKNTRDKRDVLKNMLELWLVLYPDFDFESSSKSSYFWFVKIKNYYRLYEYYKSVSNDAEADAIENLFEFLLKIKPLTNDRFYYNNWLQEFSTLCRKYNRTHDYKLLNKIRFYLKLAPDYTDSGIICILNENPGIPDSIMLKLFGSRYRKVFMDRKDKRKRIIRREE